MTAPLELWRTARWLSYTEIAQILRCSGAEARGLLDAGILPTRVDSAGRRRVKPQDLERLLNRGDEGA